MSVLALLGTFWLHCKALWGCVKGRVGGRHPTKIGVCCSDKIKGIDLVLMNTVFLCFMNHKTFKIILLNHALPNEEAKCIKN